MLTVTIPCWYLVTSAGVSVGFLGGVWLGIYPWDSNAEMIGMFLCGHNAAVFFLEVLSGKLRIKSRG